MSNTISTQAAIEALRSGKSLENKVLSDLGSSQVNAMDALLLAEHGFFVSEGNIIYDDSKIAYDPDFDDAVWGEPSSINGPSRHTKTKEAMANSERLVVELLINNEIKAWIESNEVQLDKIVEKLLTDLYYTEKLLKR